MPEDRPILPRCDNCYKRYLPWDVPKSDWHLLPLRYRPLNICISCYVRVMAAAGHSPGAVRVTGNTWGRLLAIWPICLGRTVWVEVRDGPRQGRVAYIGR